MGCCCDVLRACGLFFGWLAGVFRVLCQSSNSAFLVRAIGATCFVPAVCVTVRHTFGFIVFWSDNAQNGVLFIRAGRHVAHLYFNRFCDFSTIPSQEHCNPHFLASFCLDSSAFFILVTFGLPFRRSPIPVPTGETSIRYIAESARFIYLSIVRAILEYSVWRVVCSTIQSFISLPERGVTYDRMFFTKSAFPVAVETPVGASRLMFQQFSFPCITHTVLSLIASPV